MTYLMLDSLWDFSLSIISTTIRTAVDESRSIHERLLRAHVWTSILVSNSLHGLIGGFRNCVSVRLSRDHVAGRGGGRCSRPETVSEVDAPCDWSRKFCSRTPIGNIFVSICRLQFFALLIGNKNEIYERHNDVCMLSLVIMTLLQEAMKRDRISVGRGMGITPNILGCCLRIYKIFWN